MSALGKPNVVKADWIKDGTVIVDIGTNYYKDQNGAVKVMGDVPFH